MEIYHRIYRLAIKNVKADRIAATLNLPVKSVKKSLCAGFKLWENPITRRLVIMFTWVVNFPFFEKTDDGKWTFTHNPFSAPQDEFKEDLINKKNIDKILTAQYDITLNGYEIGGGSIRNHQAEALKKVFEIMGYEENRINENFGHMMKAFSSGTPPHGGIAWGLDRFIMLMENEPNIREVIAFAKTGEGKDLMMDSPSEIEEIQLKELGIKLR